MNLINKTKTWLLDNNILVPDDWVSACIEWIQEENQVQCNPLLIITHDIIIIIEPVHVIANNVAF